MSKSEEDSKVFDVAKIRQDFPILKQAVSGKPLVYLDNAATTQKPGAVIQALEDFYGRFNANIHRSSHGLGNQATEGFEHTRQHVARFINAASPEEVVFTRNATEAINLVAQAWGRANLKAGDEILLTQMEHHANLVPWQMVAKDTGAKVRFLPITGDGKLDLAQLPVLLTSKTKIFAFTWASNVLGTLNPVELLVREAHAVGALTLVDAAQGSVHMATDVRALGCDFLAFSGHKMLGPTGVGVLWGKAALLEAMPPYQGGGSMIETVTEEGFTCNAIPWKFEAGTPDIASVVAFDPALSYLDAVGFDALRQHEAALTRYALEKLKALPGFELYGPASLDERVGILSFNLAGVHPQDAGQLLDSMGVAVRTGMLCTHTMMQRLGSRGMIRASFYLYNTREEVDVLADCLRRVVKIAAAPAKSPA